MTRISLPLQSNHVNVNEIAGQFGGGGHHAAAGGSPAARFRFSAG